MPSYLRRRGHTWFLRWKWPSRLAAFGFSGELIRSLRTSDFRIARRRALTLVLQIETMTEATQLPNRAELESAIQRSIDDSVWRGYATLVDELRQPIADIPKVAPAEDKPAPPASFIFTEFWKSFERHKLDNREWKADTASNAEGSKNVFDKLFPACPNWSLPQLPDFKSKLRLLPRHYARGERL